MDELHPKLSQSRLNLDDKQKQTVRALRRQLSTHSTSSSTTEGDYVAELSEEEVLLLRKVVQTLTTFTADSDSIRDDVDGRKVDRNWSVESFLSSSRGSTTYVNPARFYVHVKKEEVRAVEQVCRELDDEELNTKPATNGYGYLNSKHSSSNENDRDHDYKHYGYSVAVTQQNLSSEWSIVATNNTVTEALPEDEIKFLSNGSTYYKAGHSSKLRYLPPRERFKQAVYLVIDNLKMRPPKMDQDFSELWRKRGNATWLGIFFSVVAIGAFFADIGTDLKVAADHYTAGSNWWASFTVMLVLLPSVVTNLFSFLWYKEDDEQSERRPKSGWRTVGITHFFLVGLVERYWRILVKSYRIKRKKENRVDDHKLLIAMNLDVALLQMILAFTEDAPQLVLQLYVLVSRRYVDSLQATNIQDLWTMLSICFSFISYSRAVVNYISCLRDSKRHKGQLRWYGYLSMWLWRAFMIISRILTLVFFATEFKQWFFLALLIHFLIVLVFLSRHEVYFFPGNKWKQHFVRALMSYIHMFCFFCLEGVRTIRWAVKYYILTVIEILIFSLLWFTNKTRLLPIRLEMAGFIVIYLFFSLGLIMMSIYYTFLHPRFKEARFSCNDDEDARSMAVQLLGHLAEALGPDLCKQFVGVQLEAFCEDQSFRVRKAAAGGFAEVAKMLNLTDVQRRLVPAFEKLTKDPHWGVKKAVAENLVTFALTMPANQRRVCFEPMVNNLLNDTSRFVSCAMLQQLGYFIGCLEDASSVPKTLLEEYLQVVRGSMANPDAADMSFHCAFTFAAVVRTMGLSEWPSLKAAFTALCADAQAKTRKAMAASCHIVAQALGPDLVEEEVLPSFEAFLQDPQLEVRMAAIKSVASLLQAVGRPAVQRNLLQALMSGMGKVKNWRCRHLAAQQLGPICMAFSPRAMNQVTGDAGSPMAETKDIAWRNLVPLFLQLCSDSVAQVRDAAAKSACALLSAAAPELFVDGEPSVASVEGSSGCSQQPSQSSNDFARRLIRQFARGRSFRNRMLYIRMCDSIIREAPLHVFTDFFMRPLLWLSLDKVKNVRLCWATVILPHLRKVGRLGHQRMVLAAAVRLRSTLDREVHRILEEAKLPEVSEAEIAALPDPETDHDDSDGGDVTGQEGETGSSSECGNVREVLDVSEERDEVNKAEDATDEREVSQDAPALPLPPRPVPQALKPNSPLQGPSLPPVLRNNSPSTPPGHDAVEDGLVQQQEIEKELDETFSDRRLLVEAEAMDPTSLGIERRDKEEVDLGGYLEPVQASLLPEAAVEEGKEDETK